MTVLLFRARANLWDVGNLVTLLTALPGVVTALGWLLLPGKAWLRLVPAAKLPRYIAFMLAKAVAIWRGASPPPGHLEYLKGLGIMLHQGLFLPAACLLTPGAAAVLALIKCVPCAATLLASGAAASLRQACLRCAVIGVLALVTTIFCHAYMRACFALQRHTAAERPRDGSGGVPCRTKCT
ncbi:hypothetical protein GPECTOR_2g1201 [Gonium pectorale]|uniref:Uncharacterized protein n=1 Tax=Gonium pectorale TaxID=33097 RepID=A0A150H0P1_GONPE|nr:hypothetical protein GPECTOR_2g1201 [Gonium pectorale]|eukprot:KXZ55651.1 hypothetical protein GPECTOR_2g1201 [Gonium pectorale]